MPTAELPVAQAQVVRRFVRWTYPRNGNTHNPTPVWSWDAEIDGRPVNGGDSRLSKAKAFLREFYGATTISVVREPRPENPRTQGVPDA